MRNVLRNRPCDTGTIHLKRSFYCSLWGLSACWREEYAFRKMVVLTVVLAPVTFLLPLTVVEWVILMLPLGIGLQVELLNSAIENTVDLATQEIHPLAKKAKDMGSAAQLINLVMLAGIWLFVIASKLGWW